MAKLTLYLVKETELARLYRQQDDTQQWVPTSQCRNTLKHPSRLPGELPRHEVEIADWWLEKNPWPECKQKEVKL